MRRLSGVGKTDRAWSDGASRRRPAFLLQSRLRAALPSSLVGLVTFSFVVLGFGAVVYTAALPSLVSASPVVADASKALDGASEPPDAAGAAENSSPNDSTGADGAEKADGQGSDNAGAAGQGGVTNLGGLTVPAAGDGAVGSFDSDGAGEDSAQGDDQESSAQQPDAKGDGSKQTDSDDDNTKKDDQSKPQPSENDAKAYSYIVGRTNELESLQNELAALNKTATNEFVTGDSNRAHNKDMAVAFSSKAKNAFGDVVNKVGTYNSEKYKGASADVISMYRCIYYAAETLDQAWTQSTAVAGNTEELTKLYNEAMESEQQYLDEYNNKAAALNEDLGA